jgi:hypothetical protein
MRKNTQSAADDDDTVDESFDGGRIEAMEPGASGKAAHLGAEDLATAPGWTKRLSVRSKLARALIVALTVLVALIVVLSQTTLPLPPQIARLLTPAPTRTPTPGRFSTGAFEAVPLPALSGGAPWLIPSPRDGLHLHVSATGSPRSPSERRLFAVGHPHRWTVLEPRFIAC